MTNTQIIMQESFKLMEEGIIKGSGIFGTIETAEGPKQIELPEAIHTFEGWKECGRVVRKGEHNKAAFVIWKYVKNKKKAADDEEAGGRMIRKMSYFFTLDQTEEYKPKAARA